MVAEWDRHVETKDFAEQMRGHLALEMAELSSLRRTEADAVKGALSKTADVYRRPYGRNTIRVERRCIIIGTTNESHYLVDPTGNRRFMPVKCGDINTDWIRLNRAQLFAEAVTMFREGVEWWEHSSDLAAAAQEARRIQDPWEHAIADFIERRALMEATANDLLKDPLMVSVDKQGITEMRRVAGILHRLGWWSPANAVRRNGRRARWWFISKEHYDRGEVY
jgi:predicted P-loop ATPase